MTISSAALHVCGNDVFLKRNQSTKAVIEKLDALTAELGNLRIQTTDFKLIRLIAEAEDYACMVRRKLTERRVRRN